MPRSQVLVAIMMLVAACGTAKPGGMSGPTMDNRMESTEPAVSSVISQDILNRDAQSNRTRVKHILIGWRDLEDSYGGGMDPRAQARTKAQAEDEVRSLLGQLRAGASFEQLMAEHSEDQGSADTGKDYEVTPDAALVIEFRALGLRLQVDEIGVVESSFGFHIMKRVE